MPRANRDERNAYIREWKRKNREKLTEKRRAEYATKKKLFPPKPPKIRQTQEERKKRRAESDRKYHLKNKERLNAISREYAKKNREEINKKTREKRKIKPEIKMAIAIRSRSRRLMRSKTSTSDKIGCSIKEFVVYIQNQFRDGMTWENYGSFWHLDHIKPLCSFNLLDPEEYKKASHFSNLRPLLAWENLSKNKYETWVPKVSSPDAVKNV